MATESSSKLPFPPSAAQLFARALWDPKPTTTLKSQRQLAYALGYPSEWRVERRVETNKQSQPVIYDRIHATGKGKTNYTWFYHEAAQQAAAVLEQTGALPAESHLMPPLPLYTKGDLIQVQYEGKWYNGTILKRKKQADEFLYTVHYTEDDATQEEVEEADIRPGEDPGQLAVELGFPSDWQASRKGARYILMTPTGERFTTKKAALKFLKEQEVSAAAEEDVGDPPWRSEGHAWIGRTVMYTSTHKVSGTRRIKVEQIGKVAGYIDAKDLDKEGNPGFVSEATGQPANLFHVVFQDDSNHPYAHHLLDAQDLEEQEMLECLVEEAPPKRKSVDSPVAAPPPAKKNRGRRSL